MSYTLYDSTGPLEEFASIGGYADFREWALDHPGPLRRLAQRGYEHDLEALREALEAARTVPVAVFEQRSVLLKVLRSAEDVLIVSDGMSELGDLRSASDYTDNNLVHQAADRSQGLLESAVQSAFAAGRRTIDKEKLRRAQSVQDAQRVMAKAPEAVHATLLAALPKAVHKVLVAGGTAGLAKLRGFRANSFRAAAKDDIIAMKFDAVNPQVLAWVKKHTGELAKNLTQTTKDDIAAALSRAFTEGGIGELMDDVISSVGSVDRGRLIARNEAMQGANKGQRMSWDQAVNTGLLAKDTGRVWIATSGACKACEDLDGAETTLDGEYPDEGGDGPPLHVDCRCTEGLTG